MSFDQTILNFFVNQRTEWLSVFMLVITYLGDHLVIIGLVFVLITYFYFSQQFRNILFILISISGSVITVFMLKHLFLRARPVIEALYLESGSAFPSGHATFAVAVYGFLVYLIINNKNLPLKKVLVFIFLTLIILIGLSRLYLGVHYLSDVLVGFAIGLFWLWLAGLISRSNLWHLRDEKHPL